MNIYEWMSGIQWRDGKARGKIAIGVSELPTISDLEMLKRLIDIQIESMKLDALNAYSLASNHDANLDKIYGFTPEADPK